MVRCMADAPEEPIPGAGVGEQLRGGEQVGPAAGLYEGGRAVLGVAGVERTSSRLWQFSGG